MYVCIVCVSVCVSMCCVLCVCLCVYTYVHKHMAKWLIEGKCYSSRKKKNLIFLIGIYNLLMPRHAPCDNCNACLLLVN